MYKHINAIINGLYKGQATNMLSDSDGSRRNNFTALRLMLAWSVLYRHGFGIAYSQGISDPLNDIFKGSLWIGELAVNGFFALSGFLVIGSLVKRGVVDYAISRSLRIFPALIICVFASVFLLGFLMTSLSASTYFSDPSTWRYLSNAAAFPKVQWLLPGVFETHSQKAVNGSLWTLTVEVRCYSLLALAGIFGCLQNRGLANFTLVGALLFGCYSFEAIPLIGERMKWARPSLYFLIGALAYINRSAIPLDIRLCALAALLSYFSFGSAWFDFVFPSAFVYLLLYLVYATPYVDIDGRVGDLSYGIYIYAWPVQQWVVSLDPSEGPYSNILWSSLVVFCLAYFSWHWIEQPSLRLKKRLMSH